MNAHDLEMGFAALFGGDAVAAAQALAKRACSTGMVAQAVNSVDVVLELPGVLIAVFANLAHAKALLATARPISKRWELAAHACGIGLEGAHTFLTHPPPARPTRCHPPNSASSLDPSSPGGMLRRRSSMRRRRPRRGQCAAEEREVSAMGRCVRVRRCGGVGRAPRPRRVLLRTCALTCRCAVR